MNFLPNDLFLSTKLGSYILGLIFHQQVESSSIYIQNINSPKRGHIDSRTIYLLCHCQRAHTLGESEEERAKGYWHYQVRKQKAQSISIPFAVLNHNFYWQVTISKRHFSIKCNSGAISCQRPNGYLILPDWHSTFSSGPEGNEDIFNLREETKRPRGFLKIQKNKWWFF